MSAYFDSVHPNLDVSHPDVNSYVNDYLHYVAVIKGHSLQTAFNYYIDLKEFFNYLAVRRGLCTQDGLAGLDQSLIGLAFIRKVSAAEIYEFLYMLQQEKGCKATTRNRKLSALRGFFHYMTVSISAMQSDPTASVESAKNAKTLPKFLSEEQAVDLLSNVQSDFYERDFCILTLFLNCGMRLQELVKIDMQDIKTDTILLHGKGNKQRLAYITPACMEALQHYIKARAALKNIPDSDKNALFLSKRTGRRLTPRRVEQIVERCLQSAGLSGKGFSPHKLRHTAATLMYQSGNADILELKEILGHANVATTQIYTHINTAQLRKAVNASPLSAIPYIAPDDESTSKTAEDDEEDKSSNAAPHKG